MAAKKTERKIVTLEQWVQIAVQEGQTTTTLYPSNEEMVKRSKAMEPLPDMVYRRLNFVNGVPVEYYWATSDATRRQNGGHGIQRMTIEAWLDAIEREKRAGDGHVGPCDQLLPRPKSRGGCECPTCITSRARYESQGIVVP
jgi:hypothetical protein